MVGIVTFFTFINAFALVVVVVISALILPFPDAGSETVGFVHIIAFEQTIPSVKVETSFTKTLTFVVG